MAVWVVAVRVLIVIPAKILGYGYLPMGGALRHAAKVVSGKFWSAIVVMRSDYAIDPHPGWHVVLGSAARRRWWLAWWYRFFGGILDWASPAGGAVTGGVGVWEK